MSRYPGRQRGMRGQAMTETVVAASLVLIPLFLLIPLLGKYIDIKQSAIQAARYEAWEYTAWYGSSSRRSLGSGGVTGEVPSGFAYGFPVKSPGDTQEEARRRFFGNSLTAITRNDDGPFDVADLNPLLHDHQGNPLWDGSVNDAVPQHNEDTPDVTGGVMNTIFDIIGIVTQALADVLTFVNSTVGMDAIYTKGYSTAGVNIPVTPPPGLVQTRETLGGDTDTSLQANVGTLNFGARAAVLTEGWSAGGTRHTYDRAGGMVPTTILNQFIQFIRDSDPTGLVNILLDILTYITPEIRLCNPTLWHPFDTEMDGSLWLGYIDIDSVVPDRLSIGGGINADDSSGSLQCPGGQCEFDPEPVAHTPCDPADIPWP